MPRPQQFAGPQRTAAPASGAIGWIQRREPRGEPFDSRDLIPERARRGLRGFPRGEILLSRLVQPDPSIPVRVAIVYVRDRGNLGICSTVFEPLGRRGGGIGCMPAFRAPLILLSTGGFSMDAFGPRGPQFTRLTGTASDDVASVALYFRDGAREPITVRDNVFTTSVPYGELPAKLVGFDAEGRAVAIQMISGPPVLTPCAPLRAVATARSPPPYERLDLGSATIDGHRIFERTISEVTAMLGPSELDRGRLHLAYGYGTEPGRGCVASFKGRTERLTVSFGVEQYRRRPFVFLTRQ